MNKILAGIVVVFLVSFFLFIPIIPISRPYWEAAFVRNDCVGETGPNSPNVSFIVSISYFLVGNFGVVFLPKGVPYSSDNSAFYFPPFTPEPNCLG